MKTVEKFNLTHKGELIFSGSENECYMKLQRSQSQSADWAMRYEGWKVEPTGEQIPDPIVEVELVKAFSDYAVVKYNGKPCRINQRYVHGVLGQFEPGDKFRVDSKYLQD